MHFFSCSIEYGSNYFGHSLYTKTRNGTEQLKATFRPVPPTKIRNSPLVPLTGSRSLDGLLKALVRFTRGFNNIHLEKPNTEYYRKSFDFQGAIKWNGLPKDIKKTILEHRI